MSSESGHSSSGTERWRSAGEPVATSAIRVDSGECLYDDCDNPADYLVKVENIDGHTAKFRTCQSCSDENRLWVERQLPAGSEHSTGTEGGDSS